MGKASKLFAAIVGVGLSVCVGVVLVELVWAISNKSETPKRKSVDRGIRFMLFKGEKRVFKNVDDFFIYTPNNRIRSVGFFFTKRGWLKEYDYEFSTNNLGLVQNTPVLENTPSLLILGDSFTEGQGATPWFYKLEPEIRKLGLQPLNGGLLGTGFQQFLKLHDYVLRANVTVNKVVVIFISEDIYRKTWNFPDSILNCMDDYRVCGGSEGFYQLPPEKEVGAFLDRLIGSRPDAGDSSGLGSYAAQKFQDLLPATTIVYAYVKDHVKRVMGSIRSAERERGRVPIQTLVRIYGTENVLFVHIPRMEEVITGPNRIGRVARKVISENNATLFDGFRHCGLTVPDYREIDGHPNEAGYEKIFECVRKALVPFTSAMGVRPAPNSAPAQAKD